MNRINELFTRKTNSILSVYMTAGFPDLDDTTSIICALQKNGADMIEIGMPFSDPVADGPVIQNSSQKALKNGMSVNLLFEQLKTIRLKTTVPLLLMGYLNPVFHMGLENFLKRCSETGIDGLIIPDLPMEYYRDNYLGLFQKFNLANILLITPQTPEQRMREIDELTNGFIYMVSSYSTTGARDSFSEQQETYFRRVDDLNLKSPRLIGFGVGNRKTFDTACQYANGAIVGSAFINAVGQPGSIEEKTAAFMRQWQ
ncbi:MAG TPA: tryptophan synthase subunit alpha [Bacteroidales bacterium]|nr:tryptophan synthase subunit alpha [Bacteroidales bacterium]